MQLTCRAWQFQVVVFFIYLFSPKFWILQEIHLERKWAWQTDAGVCWSLLALYFYLPSRISDISKTKLRKEKKKCDTLFALRSYRIYLCSVGSRSLMPWQWALTANNGTVCGSTFPHTHTHFLLKMCHFASLPWPAPNLSDSHTHSTNPAGTSSADVFSVCARYSWLTLNKAPTNSHRCSS